MIDWLRFSKSANFYKKRKRLPKAAIVEMFNDIRANSQSPSRNLFRHIKDNLNGTSWSAISFLYERSPSFLELPPAHVQERVSGFLLLVEHRDHVALYRSHIDVPAEFKTEYLGRIADERVDAVIARAGATFEKMNLRTMAVSRHGLQSKILEANDLQSVVGPLGANRYIRRGYRARQGSEHLSTVPNTGRISSRSERLAYDGLIEWAVLIIDQLIDEHGAPATFIRQFARSLDLASLPVTVDPTFVAVDVPRLKDNLFEVSDPVRFVRFENGRAEPLSIAETNVALAALEQTFAIRRVKNETLIYDPTNNHRFGAIFIAKGGISLRVFDLPEIMGIYVQAVNPVPGDDKKVSLRSYINRNDLLTVLFSDLAVVYLNGTLYRDELLTTGGQGILAYVHANARLSTATTEKGQFTGAHTQFDADSVFKIIIDDVAGDDDLLVCDDLGDEWADFIGIDVHSQPKKISFYHAKYGDLSLAAGPLHILISQAQKNLSRMALSNEQIAAKHAKWTATYNNEGARTLISRVAKGDVATLQQDISNANASPDTIRRVFIVTSSLSRRALQDAFAAAATGDAPSPHFVQLVWLLMAFLSACHEVNAFPYVVCQE